MPVIEKDKATANKLLRGIDPSVFKEWNNISELTEDQRQNHEEWEKKIEVLKKDIQSQINRASSNWLTRLFSKRG